ncbi:MAG: coproporphyrinogen III oxidase family protein [Coriobacteriia bacterium]|nr:coproporphyrinogen III oxidase family protein [Coriobacteriia bacterium]
MLSERMLSTVIRTMTGQILNLKPTQETRMPDPVPGQSYMLYMHVPFCERLCPYCSFNRFPFREDKARHYFQNMRKEMAMLKEQGYDFDSVYVGGGTPTILIDELCETIDQARDLFSINEVSSETNPNHLVPKYIEKLEGRVQRLSVGVQSFDNGLLKQMDRFDKYGCGEEILERIAYAAPHFTSLNADMIFNFPAQTEEILMADIEKVVMSGCTQTTFYPLMASPSVERSLARTVGKVDYDREYKFYQIIDGILAGGDKPLFEHGSAWTFNRIVEGSAKAGESAGKRQSLAHENETGMIDEYVVEYEEYPAIGSGGITYLGKNLYVNTFSVAEYNQAIESGRMSLMSKTTFNRRNRMRYRFMMQLFGLRLDKKQFKRDFGCSVEAGLPAEMAFMRANKAFATDNADELTLTPFGRYLTVVMMRQFFIGVNNLRDQARAALSGEERELIFGDGGVDAGKKPCQAAADDLVAAAVAAPAAATAAGDAVVEAVSPAEAEQA